MTQPQPGRKPYLIAFEPTGTAETGFLVSTQQADRLPFAVRRIFWTYAAPPAKSRGGHANFETEEVMVAVRGGIEVETELPGGERQFFRLQNPTQGLYVPALCWLTIRFLPETVLLCFASTDYNANTYIRDLAAFRNLPAS